MNLTGAIQEYLLTKRPSITEKTFRWYDQFLGYFLAWCHEQERPINTLDQLTAGRIAEFVNATTPNPHTRHARAQIVKGFLSWCSQDPEFGVKHSLVDRIEMPKLIETDVELFTPEDIRRLLAECEKTQFHHRNRAIIHILLDTGIRASECCLDAQVPQEETGLRMENLFLGRGDDNHIRVMGKGRKGRTIGVGHETTLAMQRYLNRERLSDSPFVFVALGGAPLSVRMLQHLLGDLGERAGVPDCHPHRFRHHFAVSQLLAGTSDLVLMRLMGHTSLDATRIYTRAMTQVQARQAAPSIMDQMKRKRP